MPRPAIAADAISAEHYISVRPRELIQKLADEPAVTIFERPQFTALCDLLESIVHFDCHAKLKRLLDGYSHFHPDDDRACQAKSEPAVLERAAAGLFEEFAALVTCANYRHLSRSEVERAASAPGPGGLQLALDWSIFERLEVYARGEHRVTISTVSPTTKRRVVTEVSAYRRLAIIFRLKAKWSRTEPLETRAVFLKLFKDIPRDDLEALLPGAWVQLGLFDQAKIVVPTISGLALTLFKLLKGAAVATFASLSGLLVFLGLIGGALGYGVRSLYSFWSVRERHQLTLTRQLYYQNLDNNAGVLYHLLAEAEEQELREMVLAYWLLWRGGLSAGDPQQIDAAAETWLRDRCGVLADFEISDALAKLERLGLAYASSTGRWRAVAVEEALERLDRYWDDQFDHRRRSTTDDHARPLQIYRRAA